MSAADELIDDALSSVGEVPELGLPQHQGVRIRHGVAQLETEDAVLRQGGVSNTVGSLDKEFTRVKNPSSGSGTNLSFYLVRVEVGQGVVGGLVFGLVMQDVVTMGESAALNVLPGQTDVSSLLQQGAERHGLG